MTETTVATVGFLVLSFIEGFNGLGLAFRTKRTLTSAGVVHADGPGLLIQEFGVYSVGIAVAYLVAALDPIRFCGIGIAGIVINLLAGGMHLFRSAGVYFGDARPMMNRASERKASFVHAFALLVLFISQRGVGPLT